MCQRHATTFVLLGALVMLGALLWAPASYAVTGRTTTYLGKLYAGDGGDALNAYLDNPDGFARDASGNFFIADTFDNVIRKIDTANVMTTFAGTGQVGKADGTKLRATFQQPQDVAVHANGTVYVADSLNGRIREIRNGRVSTWSLKVKLPTGLALNGDTLYIADEGGNQLLVANVTTKRATRVATIASPHKVTVLGLYAYVVSNGQTRVTQVTLKTGKQKLVKSKLQDASGITTCGTSLYFTAGLGGIYNEIWKMDTAISGQVAQRIVNRLETEWYNYASDITCTSDALFLLSSHGSSLFRLDLDGNTPVRLAGAHRYGSTFGLSPNVMLGRPRAFAVSKNSATVYLAQNHQFAAYDVATKTLRFLASHFNDNYREDTGENARTSQPSAIALAPDQQTLYFVDRNNNRVRSLNVQSGTTSYLTGAGGINANATTKNAYREGGPCVDEFRKSVAGCAYFDRPSGLALSTDGKTLYVADTLNNRLRTVDTTTGRTKLLAGSGRAGLQNGTGTSARFNAPYGLALSTDGKTLYVADRGNHVIRAMNLSTRRVTTLAGDGRAGYREGTFARARFSLPEYLTVGANSTLYVSDPGTQRIRMLNLKTRTTRLLAGSGQKGSVNGPGSRATFLNPRGVALLGTQLLVADSTNDLIRKVETK